MSIAAYILSNTLNPLCMEFYTSLPRDVTQRYSFCLFVFSSLENSLE